MLEKSRFTIELDINLAAFVNADGKRLGVSTMGAAVVKVLEELYAGSEVKVVHNTRSLTASSPSASQRLSPQ